MNLLPIFTFVCVLIQLVALIVCVRKDATAEKRLQAAKQYHDSTPVSDDTPLKFEARLSCFGYAEVVAEYYCMDKTTRTFVVKRFPYDPNDIEDMDFAYSEALELKEHLS